MTLEISPVLAGTYDAQNYAPSNNVASTSSDDATTSNDIDNRRYTKFDRSTTEAGTMTNFSFGDFVDMINPLQHIPLVSSIYREVTGDTINPVSRVVGNIVYGGAVGVASAVIGALGGGADDLIEQDSGKDSVGGVLASLFGSDNPASPAATTQLASATNSVPADSSNSDKTAIGNSPAPTMASAQTVVPQLASLKAPAQTTNAPVTQGAAQLTAQAQLQAAMAASAKSSAIASAMPKSDNTVMGNEPPALQALNVQKSFVIDPNKLPYGGVMAPPVQGNSLQGNNMAVSLANSAPGLQMNHTVYTSKKLNSLRPTGWTPPAVTATTATSAPAISDQATAISSTSQAASETSTALPPELMSDIAALRAINQYRNTASQGSGSGQSLNIVN